MLVGTAVIMMGTKKEATIIVTKKEATIIAMMLRMNLLGTSLEKKL